MTACRAPSTSLYLDPSGDVRACCKTSQPLGNVSTMSLLDMWRGQIAEAQRRALAADDFSYGCEFCGWSVEAGHPEVAFARRYDSLDLPTGPEIWPRHLEMALSNTCNLMCIMCNGGLSSSIRAQREHLPPLPKMYHDGFFEELSRFVPHLERVHLLGGEPFLAAESMRVLDLLVEMGSTARVQIMTNGTHWTPRVERILEQLQVDISVSLDATTAETYESIRIGASWDEVQTNLGRFLELAPRRETIVGVSFCLMDVNWHELFDFCLLADRHDIDGYVNAVADPINRSLLRMGPDRLGEVLAQLEAIEEARGHELGRNRAVWLGELAKVRASVTDQEEGRALPWPQRAPTGLDSLHQNTRFDVSEPASSEQLTELVGPERLTLFGDQSGWIRDMSPTEGRFGIARADVIGENLDNLVGLLEIGVGPLHPREELARTPLGTLFTVDLVEPGVVTGLRVLASEAVDDDGITVGTLIHVATVSAAP